MKKAILALTTLALAGAGVQNATAGEHEWATAGKILTGVVAASVITRALDAQPCYSAGYYTYAAPAYTYCPPPAPVTTVVYETPRVVVAPAPVVVYRAPVVDVRIGGRHWDRDDFRGGHHDRRHYHRR